MAKILFVPSVGRGIIQFKLILAELNKGGVFTVTTIAIDRGRGLALEKEGFHARPISEYRTRNMLKIIRQEKPDILITDFGTAPTINMVHAAKYLEIPALMIDCGIKSDASPIVKAQNKHLLSKFGVWIKSGQKFQSLPFDLATLPSISRPWQVPSKLAGVILGFLKGMPGYVEGLNIAVLSPLAKDWFAHDGYSRDHLFVIGQPRFDLILKQKYDAAKLRGDLGIPAGTGIIVLATQPMVESYLWTEKEREKFVASVAGAMKDFPGKRLVIKLHPDEKIEIYRKILSDIGDDKSIVTLNADTYELLNACDLLLTYYSTVALEAMLFNKPVITVNLFGGSDIFPYAKSGAALGAYREEDLVPAMKKALYDSPARAEMAAKSRDFAYEQAYKADGLASRRGADLILQLVEQAAARRKSV